MSYNIRHLDNVTKLEGRYFFDANLWLTILKPPTSLNDRQLRYFNFFERFKLVDPKPKIAITAPLLSEVINRYIRDVGYERFCNKNGVKNPHKSYYKQNYRISKAFKDDYTSICDDIYAYSDFFELIEDGFGSAIKLETLLNDPPLGLDLNDHYYYLLAKLHNISIVTDDGDFFVPNVSVLTYNGQLIERAKNELVKMKLAAAKEKIPLGPLRPE